MKIYLSLLNVFSLVVAMSGCAQTREPLFVTGGVQVHYRCEFNRPITARYYSVSDRSLEFVKLILENGQEYTLPKIAVPLGERYTANRELAWGSTDGKMRFLEKRDENGQWSILYKSCYPL